MLYDFLSSSICSVLNCCTVLHHLAKVEALLICCGGLRINETQLRPVESHALTSYETYELRNSDRLHTHLVEFRGQKSDFDTFAKKHEKLF